MRVAFFCHENLCDNTNFYSCVGADGSHLLNGRLWVDKKYGIWEVTHFIQDRVWFFFRAPLWDSFMSFQPSSFFPWDAWNNNVSLRKPEGATTRPRNARVRCRPWGVICLQSYIYEIKKNKITRTITFIQRAKRPWCVTGRIQPVSSQLCVRGETAQQYCEWPELSC